jgi:hypothetical protein
MRKHGCEIEARGILRELGNVELESSSTDCRIVRGLKTYMKKFGDGPRSF